jgi:hypothetical protein
VGTTVADGLTMVKKVVVGGGADAPEGELWTGTGWGEGLTPNFFSVNWRMGWWET